MGHAQRHRAQSGSEKLHLQEENCGIFRPPQSLGEFHFRFCDLHAPHASVHLQRTWILKCCTFTAYSLLIDVFLCHKKFKNIFFKFSIISLSRLKIWLPPMSLQKLGREILDAGATAVPHEVALRLKGLAAVMTTC